MAKFRSWNENRNQFYYWQDGYYFKNKECTDDWNMISVWFNWQNAEQSTGLKDKEEKEIFVGDTVEGNFPYARKCIVIYDNKMAGCYLQPFDNNEISRPAYSKYYKLNGVKVIITGNIHEVEE